MVTQAELKRLLRYNALTGVFTWRIRRQGVTVGRIAGSVTQRGYRLIEISDKIYKAHRLAWLYCHSRWPRCGIDHANRDRDDNRLGNLREAGHKENGCNRGPQANSSSGIKGVSPSRGKWLAQISDSEGKRQFLGRYDDIDDAAIAYEEAAQRFHGRFARTI